MQHDDIDKLLTRRVVPPSAPRDLSERIIHAALMAPRATILKAGWWEEVLSMFVLPNPSVAVVAGVVVGLLLGVQASEGFSLLQTDWSSFLEINEGDWL